MKNALEKEEALDELGQSFQNYLSILHSDESVADSMSNITSQGDSSRMVTLDPYTVNQRIRRASILHVKRLSHAVDEEEKKNKSNVLFWLFLSVTAAIVGCSLGLVIYKTASPEGATAAMLPNSIITTGTSSVVEKVLNNEFADDIKLPAFINVFAKNDEIVSNRATSSFVTDVANDKQLPLLLNVPGTGSEHLPTVFSKCFGLKEASSLQMKDASADFASVDTLCGVSRKFKVDSKARLLIFMRNPIVRVVQEYLNKNKNLEVTAESLIEYMKDEAFVDNQQTRKLVCKPKGAVSDVDLTAAKYMLKKLSVISMYQDSTDSFKSYRTAFSWKASSNIDQCIGREFESNVSLNSVDVEKHLNENDVVKAIRERNEMDMKLYLYALNLN